MALNPSFENQMTRKLPLAFGYVQGAGDEILATTTPNGSIGQLYLMAEGEWEGPEMLTLYNTAGLRNNIASDNPPGRASWYSRLLSAATHFHGGSYTPKGLGVTAIPSGTGPGQAADINFPIFPTVTPTQSFSGTAYALYSASLADGIGPLYHGALPSSIVPYTPVGIWRTTRCRTFDAAGNILTYQFTCNPAWHFVEAMLRYKIKPQQPPLAGLTVAERACFNWPSIAANAARNAFILPNGKPRFAGNYIFAAVATLTNILETILRCSRSYRYTRSGQIHLMGDDARGSVFSMTAKHFVPGTLRMGKKDVSKAPNVFVPNYRDLEPPAVCTVASVGASPDGVGNGMSFNLQSLNPFFAGDIVVYGGSSNAAANQDYQVRLGQPSPGATPAYDPYRVDALGPVAGVLTATGGVLGSNNARFSKRAPTNVQHRSHQKMVASQAPGLAVQPRVTPVYYDCGNSTFDQTNRIMKFERDFLLGTDIGAGWMAPISGTLTAWLEAIDANGKLLSDVNPRDVITLDDWITPEFAGQYVVMDPIVINPPDTRRRRHDRTLAPSVQPRRFYRCLGRPWAVVRDRSERQPASQRTAAGRQCRLGARP